MYLFNEIRAIMDNRIKCRGKHGLISDSRPDLLSTQNLQFDKYFYTT